MSEILDPTDDMINDEEVFDPNDRKYTCCCQHVHASTGLRVICGMLWITVVFEVWQLTVTVYAHMKHSDSPGSIESSLVQFLIGFVIASSVFYAVKREKAAMLVPYLVIQMVGLASSAVFFVAFVYIALFGDRETAATFIKSHGRTISREERQQSKYLNYVSWMMVGSFAMIIVLQIWLMSVVLACWRYYRDKRTFERLNGYSYFVLQKNEKDSENTSTMRASVSMGAVSSHKASVIKKSRNASLECV